ncbi:MAG: GumC family protein [Alphaproteobacteria bacterium]
MVNEITDKAEAEAGAGELVPAASKPAEVALVEGKASEPAPPEDLPWMRGEPRLLSRRGMLRMLRRRRVIIIATAAVVTVGAAIYAFSATPLYRAEAKIIVEPDKNAAPSLQGLVPGAQPDLTVIQTQAAVISSSELAALAVDRLHLAADPRFNPALKRAGGGLGAALDRVVDWLEGGGSDGASTPELLREAVVNNYLAGLHVVPDEHSRVIGVLYDSPSADLAARAANTAAALYVEQQSAPRDAGQPKDAAAAPPTPAELAERVAAAERKLVDFQRSSASAPVGAAAVYVQQMARLDDQLSQLRLDIAEAKTRGDQAQQVLASPDKGGAADTPIDNLAVQALRQQASKLDSDLAEFRTQYLDTHPKVQEALAKQADLRNKIRAELARAAQTLRSQYDLAKSREQKLMQEQDRLQGKMREQRDADAQRTTLESGVKTSRELYEAALARQSAQKPDGQKQAPPARVISQASVPTAPAFPRKSEIVAVAFGISLVLGLVLALAAEYFESGFRTRSELETRTGLAVLGLVPIVPKSATSPGPPHMRAIAEPNSTYGEAIRALRSALLQPRGDYRPRVIMVTSSVPGEGKTSTAVSIATTAARARLRTIIVECDVLRPSLYLALGCTIGPGLGDYLSGRATIEEIVRVDATSGAHYVTAGEPMPNASDLLDGDGLKLLINGMREVYDLVVIDSPPVLAVSDTVVVQRLVDETIFLVRWKKTPRDIVYAALRQLAENGGTISGLGLTQVDVRKHSLYEFGKHADKYYSAYRSYHSDAA